MAKLPPYLGFMQDAKTRNSNLLASYQCLGECTDLEADTYTLIILLLSKSQWSFTPGKYAWQRHALLLFHTLE